MPTRQIIIHPKAEQARERLIASVREEEGTIPVTLSDATCCQPRIVYEAIKQNGPDAIWKLGQTDDDQNDFMQIMAYIPLDRAAPVVTEMYGLDLYELMAHLNSCTEGHNYLIEGLLCEEFWHGAWGKDDAEVWATDQTLQILFRVIGIRSHLSCALNVGFEDAEGRIHPHKMRAYRYGDVYSNRWPDSLFTLYPNEPVDPESYFGDDQTQWPGRLHQMTLELVSRDAEWCEAS